MATLHVSETEAIRDIASLLAKVRTGIEVVIESEDSTIAVLTPPGAAVGEEDAGYDEWFRAEIQKGLDCDPATDVDEETAEAYFAERRRAILATVGESE